MTRAGAQHVLDAAEPARHALLGFLLDGPRHGYDLARHFMPASALGSVVHLSTSHLYALLTRLERDGLITGERHEEGSRPPRRVYSLTPAGREAFLRWVDTPVGRPRDVLLHFPLKLYLARRLSPARAAVLVARQRALFADYLRRLENGPEYPGAPQDADFVALMRAGRIERTRGALAWLDRCAAMLPSVQEEVEMPTEV